MEKRTAALIPLVTSLFFLMLHCSALHAQSSGISSFAGTSGRIESFLARSNVRFTLQSQVPPFAGQFPRNISVEIPPDTEKAEADADKSGITSVFFIFSHDYVLENSRFMLKFIRLTQEKKLPYRCTIVFTADREKPLLPQESGIQSATELFAESIHDADSSCAVLVRSETAAPPFISTEGDGTVSPQWIVQTLKKACMQNQKPAGVKSSILYIYRPQAYRNNRRLSAFLRNEIPAAEIPLGHTEKDLAVLSSIEDILVLSRSSIWNRHYNFIPAGTAGIWLNEAQIAFIYLLFTAGVLFFICFYSFSYSGKNEAVLKDISRTWFFIPAYAVTTAAALTLFQNLFFFARENPILYFSLKTVPAIFVMLSALYMQVLFGIRVSLSATNFFCILCSAISVFVFTALDLSLMIIFIAECAIAFIFRKRQSVFFSMICIALMIIPFLFLLSSVFIDAGKETVLLLIRTPFAENVLLSCALLPFLFQWKKLILVSHFSESRRKNARKRILAAKGIVLSALFSGTLYAVLQSAAVPLRHGLLTDDSSPQVQEAQEPPADIAFRSEDIFSLRQHRISIAPRDGFSIVRCVMTLETDAFVPFYECNFGYSMVSAHKTQIAIPDFPENEADVIFSSDRETAIAVSITVYAADSSGHLVRWEKQLYIEGTANEQNL
ncbi:MAG: hypothetical protein J6K96_01155 [Treponema sp.]|nr:hypothetical protein [Treponema sp.]